ncbi:c-type cytochrome [Marinovum sp.]|uniref:c-type cytochrome n=1 Tax=Marinovum sp. TaxID=2024839 RepID=UPI003A8F9924
MTRTTTALAIAAVLFAGLALSRLLPSDALVSAPETAQGSGESTAMVEVALPAEFSGNGRIGKTIFEAKCAACHGPNAAGQDGVAPPLVHKIYEPSHHSDAAFLLAAQNGVRSHHWRFGDMPPVEGVTQGDVTMVTAYVRELQRANGIN